MRRVSLDSSTPWGQGLVSIHYSYRCTLYTHHWKWLHCYHTNHFDSGILLKFICLTLKKRGRGASGPWRIKNHLFGLNMWLTSDQAVNSSLYVVISNQGGTLPLRGPARVLSWSKLVLFFKPRDNRQTWIYSLVWGQSDFRFKRNKRLKICGAYLPPP